MDKSWVIAVRNPILFPGTIRAVTVKHPSQIAIVQTLIDAEENVPVFFVPVLDVNIEDPVQAGLIKWGVWGHILRVRWQPDGSASLLVEGFERIRLTSTPTIEHGMLICQGEVLPTKDQSSDSASAEALELEQRYRDYATAQGVAAEEYRVLTADATDGSRLADQVATQVALPREEQLELLSVPSVPKRIKLALKWLTRERVRQTIQHEIEDEIMAKTEGDGRKAQIREQIRWLRQRLGEATGGDAEADQFLVKLDELKLKEVVHKEIQREIERLRHLHIEAAEYTILRTWIQTAIDVPWNTLTTNAPDLKHAEKILDDHHYGLKKVKDRLLEDLAVRQLAPGIRAPILCLVGPPGVGKTSLGQSIAQALGRKYARIAMGGMRDESEIRGHRRTYVGALPGRLLRALTRAQSRNPVIVLDEIDKLGTDSRGDPASALLEVLDPEQNKGFVDHYLDLPVDLSAVLFIATANSIDPIPAALEDRMEFIHIPGYTEEEKQQIAKHHLLPKMYTDNGLTNDDLHFTDSLISKVISGWTREAGVRELQRVLSKLFRKTARAKVEGKPLAELEQERLTSFLGPSQSFTEVLRTTTPGLATGLAWTSVGGTVLHIEVEMVPGKGELHLTGHLGKVMKESASIALTYIKAHYESLQIDPTLFSKHDLHLHVPEGSIPKDGPSAGITILTAMTSRFTKRPLCTELAMTGELTLRGAVLAIGGVKEKLLAARRAGVKHVLLPKANKNDLLELPTELIEDLTITLVEHASEVLELALLPTLK